jgi:hypothetical protein
VLGIDPALARQPEPPPPAAWPIELEGLDPELIELADARLADVQVPDMRVAGVQLADARVSDAPTAPLLHQAI